MQTENTTKICECMEDDNPQDIPIQHGDLSEIARIVGVTHAHVSRWYNNKNVHRAKLHDEMMKALLKLHAKRMKAKEEIKRLKEEQGL